MSLNPPRREPPRTIHPDDPELAEVVRRNIRTLVELRQQFEQRRTRQDRVADAITRFTGSMPFVYLHAGLFALWILVNVGAVPGVRPFDPFPFVMLAMWASVEAIFLSTFVLISQNRMAALADKRADLDLQISLLTEHEVTRVLALVDAMAQQMGIHSADEAEVEKLKEAVRPEAVLHEIEEVEQGADELELHDEPESLRAGAPRGSE
ncbi:MAG TPA: DUF1003 domain-containing protein [Armatimonadota bacterium]|nr:DUF1003 domain-containing protein [Armatimonadota bacterium]